MLNEKLLLQTLKNNFEKLNKTKLSEFENDLYYTKKIPFLTLIKDDNIETLSSYDRDGNLLGLRYIYKQTPKIDWMKNSNSIGYRLRMKTTSGEHINQTENEYPVIYEEIPVLDFTDDYQNPTESSADTIYIPVLNDYIELTSGLYYSLGSDVSDDIAEDAFYVRIFQFSNLFDSCTEFKLELYRIEHKKIPLKDLEIDENQKLPANYIDLTSLDSKFASINFPYFTGAIALGESVSSPIQLEDQGDLSFSSGENTQAKGYASFSQGIGTIASDDNQHVIGRYNSIVNLPYFFVVGNGLNNNNRSNAHTIDSQGNAWYAGNVFVGGDSEQDIVNSNKLATMEDIDSYFHQSKNSICLFDRSTGLNHIVQIENGILISFVKTCFIQVKTNPIKTDYSETQQFDSTGMEIIAICEDGSERDITKYVQYDEFVTINSNTHTITYTENDNKFITTVPIITCSLQQALTDFYYRDNLDGTYTITNWHETLNGVSNKEELIIPNSSNIIL